MTLDAITQEIVISLRDEPERWGERDLPRIARVAQFCVQRDDGLVLSERESLVSPWRMRTVAVFAGDGRYVPKGADERAVLRGLDGWRAWRSSDAVASVRRFLAGQTKPSVGSPRESRLDRPL